MARDGLSFRARLRPNVTWHDGKPFTADDYVTMFGYTRDETLLKAPSIKKHQGLLGPVKDVKALDPQTVEFQFGAPVPYFTDILDYWFAIRIVDKEDVKFMEKLPIATGPFKLVQYVPNQFAKLVRFDSYYQKDLPVLDEIMFRRLEKAETLIPNLQSGAVHGIQVTSLSDVGPLKADPNYVTEINESAGSVFNIMVNVTKPPLDRKEVRQALSYALNRAEMAKSAFFGVSRPITSPFFSPASLAYREDLVMAHPFDLDRARALLDRAGVKNLELTFNATPRWPQMKLFGLVWQADLAKIGVKLTVNEVEVAKFYEIGGAKDLLGNDLHPWLNARTTRDPAIFWSTQVNYRGNEKNPYGYRNAELEKLVEAGAVELDPARRKQIYQKLNEIVVEESNIIHVATDPRVWVFSKAVKDVRFDLNGNLFLDRARIEK
jgi:peptide/nickel transport system substrate-binding protein